MIPEDYIDYVRETVDIVSVVSQYCELVRKGSNHISACPFPEHVDSDPSFAVSASKRIYKCFGCGRGGNVFTFLMDMEGYTFPEAVRFCAEKIGAEFDYDLGDSNYRDQLYTILSGASAFYQACLNKTDKLFTYLVRDRGLKRGIIERFGIGYGGNYYKRISGVYDDECLLASGIFTKREDTGIIVDSHRGKYIIPIVNTSGKAIALWGNKKESEPKYCSSHKSLIYDKSKALFGFLQAKDAIKNNNLVILVEGFFDVLTMAQNGVKNVVGLCGTALTPAHAKILHRHTNKVVLFLDGDSAGRKALLSAFSTLYDAGFDRIYVTKTPDKKDPDEIFKVDRGVGITLLHKSVPFFTLLKSNGDLSTVIRNIRRVLSKISNMERRRLFATICAKKLKIEEKVLWIDKGRVNNRVSKFVDTDISTKEYAILASLVNVDSVSDTHRRHLEAIRFDSKAGQVLLATFLGLKAQGRDIGASVYDNLVGLDIDRVTHIITLAESGIRLSSSLRSYHRQRKQELLVKILGKIRREEENGDVSDRSLKIFEKVVKYGQS